MPKRFYWQPIQTSSDSRSIIVTRYYPRDLSLPPLYRLHLLLVGMRLEVQFLDPYFDVATLDSPLNYKSMTGSIRHDG